MLIQEEVKEIYVWEDVGQRKIEKVMTWVGGVEKQIRPSWWKPWANTVAYRKWENNTQDSSWKWVVLSGTWTSSFSSSIKKVWNYSWNNSGKSYYLQIPNTSKLSSSFTILTWIYFTSWSSDRNRSIFADWDTSNLNFHIYQNASSRIIFDSGNGSSEGSVQWPTVSTWTWYHLVITRDGSTCKIYSNWALYSSRTTYSWKATSSSTPFLIGKRVTWDSSSNTFGWYLDETILENKARTADEIQNYYNLTKSNYGL